MTERRRRRQWWPGVLAALALLVTAAPGTPAVAREELRTPVTVPALTDWSPESGSYAYGRDTRLVAGTGAERRVAGTLAADLRAAGHGTVPVVGAEPGPVTSLSTSSPADPRSARRDTNSTPADGCR